MTIAALCAGALACTSPPYQGPRAPLAGAEVPPEVDYWRGNFKGAGGVDLFEQGWRPSRPARAALVFVHGLKDHSSRYRDLGIQLAHRGIAFYAFDLRGHGYSEGVRDHIDSIDSVIEDLGTQIARVRDRLPGVPLFVGGQGFGADLAALWAARNKPDLKTLAGLVLADPMLRGEVKRGERIGLRASAIFGGETHKLEVNLADFSTDPSVVAALKSDPIIYDGQPTAATARELLRASDELQKDAPTLTTPVFVLFGGADKLTNVELGRALEANLGASDKKLTVFDGLAYDVFHEPQRDEVISAVLGWVGDHGVAALRAEAEAKAKAEAEAKASKAAASKTAEALVTSSAPASQKTKAAPRKRTPKTGTR